MKIRFRIDKAPRFLKLLGAKDMIVVQVEDYPLWDGIDPEWRDATPEDMIHAHEGTVN